MEWLAEVGDSPAAMAEAGVQITTGHHRRRTRPSWAGSLTSNGGISTNCSGTPGRGRWMRRA
jgi:hypothetical protein